MFGFMRMIPLIMHLTYKETVIYMARVLYKQWFIIICITIISEIRAREEALGCRNQSFPYCFLSGCNYLFKANHPGSVLLLLL